jgi:Uncharacterised nucleotidyltransferase
MLRRKDHYQFHRNALRPLLPGAGPEAIEQASTEALKLGENAFTKFLLHQGLGPMWDNINEESQILGKFSTKNCQLLHQSRLQTTGDYLLQRERLSQIRKILETADIPHAIIKGAHTREVYFPEPLLRPAVDIDVLIQPANKIAAIKAFQKADYRFHGNADNIAQDCSLLKGNTTIDLHWDILRPGRTRKPMVDALLADRMDYGSHWGLNHIGTLFIILVHPVFRKYANGPSAKLVRLIDLLLLLHRHPSTTSEVLYLLHESGLNTAGWITCTWLNLLTGSKAAQELATQLAPAKVRQSYLSHWIRSDLSTRLFSKTILVQLGFTLFAHDHLEDAWRAAKSARACRTAGPKILKTVKNAVS